MKKNKGVNKERTFGVEIELIGLTVDEAERILRDEFMVEGSGWVRPSRREYPEGVWKVVPDGSLRGDKTCEVVSPPMSIDGGGLEDLERVLHLLKEAGATVNSSCGIHVHHDINDFDDIRHFQQLLALYVRYEGTIDSFMPESRRRNYNRYCESLLGTQRRLNSESVVEFLDELRQQATPEEIVEMLGTRYKKVNLASYTTYGTVEFRQHSGSLDFEKIKSWIIFTQALVERSYHGRVQMDVKPENLDDSYVSLRKAIRGYKWMGADEYLIDAMTYLNNRAKKFEEEMAG